MTTARFTAAPLDGAHLLIEPTEPPGQRPGGDSAVFWRGRLADRLGVSDDQIHIESGRGSPPAAQVAGRPVWLSVSRTAGARACAVRFTGPIGVDIERVRPFPELDGMMAVALTQSEIAGLVSVPAHDLAEAFLGCWTRKEAVLKAAGCGLRADPREVSLDPAGESPGVARLRGDLYTTRLDRLGDLVVAIATPTAIEPV